MYRFQISAQTQMGESIALIGSTPSLGMWDITKCVLLQTNENCYPLWWTDTTVNIQVCEELDRQRVEYKYVRFGVDGTVQWEEISSNRWIPINSNCQSSTIVMDDGVFGHVQSYPCAYMEESAARMPLYDGQLEIFKEDDQHLRVINTSDHEYSIHPLWQEVRSALKAMPSGVYEALLHPDAPFRTLIIGKHGLESRVKISPQSTTLFQYKCKLSDISRIAIIPLGDRCAVRMMLYKIEYDGPAFPFDLTRTTQIRDVVDMLGGQFSDLWNPAFLHYDADLGRIYHTKWTGLSFAHELENLELETIDSSTVADLSPVWERMRVRYSARFERLWYTLRTCDKVLFIRTGISDRESVILLVNELEKQCQGKPFHLLLFSPQSSDQFSDLSNVRHYNLEFNPDQMYADLNHWMQCAETLREILESLGISSKNLFWCPPNPSQES